MPTGLSKCVGIEMNGKFYIAGGSENVSNAIFCFQPDSYKGQWTEKTYLSGKIEKIQLSTSNELLHVIVNSKTLHTYDTVKNVWLEVCRIIKHWL